MQDLAGKEGEHQRLVEEEMAMQGRAGGSGRALIAAAAAFAENFTLLRSVIKLGKLGRLDWIQCSRNMDHIYRLYCLLSVMHTPGSEDLCI